MNTYTEQRKNEIIAELRTLGVDKCIVEYSGEGDSGSIHTIAAYLTGKPEALDVDELCALAETDTSRILINVTDRLLGEKTTKFSKRIEELAYDALDHAGVDDWVNNDGGYGTMTINVLASDEYEAGSIHIKHSTYFIKTNDSSFML